MRFFDNGSLWKHKNLGITARISSSPRPGVYHLTWEYSLEEFNDPERLKKALPLPGSWTSSELLLNFKPIPRLSKWEELLGRLDHDILEE